MLGARHYHTVVVEVEEDNHLDLLGKVETVEVDMIEGVEKSRAM